MFFLQTKPALTSDRSLRQHFLKYQIDWIVAEDSIHKKGRQAVALGEKSVRVGWTYCDAFKNVRKRILNKKRDYLFATKDYQSALEYVRQAYEFAEIFDVAKSIVSHGEAQLALNRLDADGRPSAFTEDVRVGMITFDNGSRIIAFSANPQAMAVYGGDVGLDEFAKDPNARLLWETAQGRIAHGFDLAVWSAHDGEDTLFNEFAQQARAGRAPWNFYLKVTMEDAIKDGLLDRINHARGTHLDPKTFLEDCRARAGNQETFEQAYMCNPLGAATNHIVEWSCIEQCRYDYPIERVHLENEQIRQQFGEFHPSREDARQTEIHAFLRRAFDKILTTKSTYRMGFDVAASGQGDLAAFYIDEVKGNYLWLRGLLTCRTEDWNFIRTVLFYFLRMLQRVQAAGDETGLGRQICWEASEYFRSIFTPVNFASEKHDLGFALMNQLASAQKRFPKTQPDIAADFFALRKVFQGNRWLFMEGNNSSNPASHCDIAWAGALATHAHGLRRYSAGGAVA
jgi:phage FluMu gp28-like protein